MDDREKQIEERWANATRGPWRWAGYTSTKSIQLVAQHSGRKHVMAFARWGTQRAQPWFNVDGIMRDLKELARVDHSGTILGIDHPDAEAIERAPEDVAYLQEQLAKLRAELAAERARRERLREEVRAVFRQHDTGENAALACAMNDLLACLDADDDAAQKMGAR